MFEKELLLAHELAEASGQIIIEAFRKPIEIDDKADSSPVTIADKNAEKVMRDKICSAFPNHGIVGEEFGKENENSDFVWVLDPIDGTKSFISGLPLFGTLIALLYQGKPVLGVINQPFTKERWIGVENQPTTLNGQVIQTRKCSDLSKAILCSTAGRLMFSDASEKQRFDALCDKVATTRFSTDCYGYGLLSAGCVDVVCEAQMKLYDYAAHLPVVNGAGGVLVNWNGQDLFQGNQLGQVLAVGDKALLPQITEVLI